MVRDFARDFYIGQPQQGTVSTSSRFLIHPLISPADLSIADGFRVRGNVGLVFFLRYSLFHCSARSLVILLGTETFRFRHSVRRAVLFKEPHDASEDFAVVAD
jgi:hypothetical protein